MAGGFDDRLKTHASATVAYRESIGNVIWTLPDMREARKYAVLEEATYTRLPVPGVAGCNG